jgi:hypothetical protein
MEMGVRRARSRTRSRGRRHAAAAISAGSCPDRAGEKVKAPRTELLASAVILRSEATKIPRKRIFAELRWSSRGRYLTPIGAIEWIERPDAAVGEPDGEPRCVFRFSLGCLNQFRRT